MADSLITENELSSDLAMVQAALADPAAFREVVVRYEAPLSRYLVRLGVRTPEDRQDLLQDIFIKVYRNLASFDQSLKFSSWIYRIAHNETMSWYRRLKVRPEGYLIGESDEVLTLQRDERDGADALFDRALAREEVQAALNQLPEKYRLVLILRYFEHKEYDEIGDILEIPIGTVGTLVHRGKKKLSTILEDRPSVEPQ